MTNMKIMNKRIPLILSLIVMLIATGVHFVFAEAVHMDDLTKETSSLLVIVQYNEVTKEGGVEATPISGAELTVYKVADMSVNEGLVEFVPTKDFESVPVDYKSMTADDSNKAAADLYKKVESAKIAGKRAVTDAMGEAQFGELPNGMYLIAQTGASGDAENYTRLNPYLAMLPMQSMDAENEWNYEVESFPKTELGIESIRITKKVNNEDNVEVQLRTDDFTYDIKAELGYIPDGFAVVDKVPETLEIINTDQIELTISNKVLSKEERDAMLKIEDNAIKIEFNKEQLKKWYPLSMNVKFQCKFRDAEEQTEDLSVINTAGYEVLGVYEEPPGEEHKAEVKGKTKKTPPPPTKLIKGIATGDYNNIIMWVGLLVAAVLAVIIIRRRSRDRG